MRSKSVFQMLGVGLLLCIPLACNPLQVTSETAPPGPTETAAPQGIPVSFSGTSFSIPDGLANGAGTENVAAMDGEPLPAWETTPAFTQFTLEHYQTPGALLQPRIYVYVAAEYAAVNTNAAKNIQLLGAATDFSNQNLPVVPFINATQAFAAQVAPLKFRNGAGLRMLTQYAQNARPINNSELVYHFEGLTGDGRYYIIAIFPVSHPSLAADGKPDSVVPAGGIPFNQDDPAGYFAAISKNLNNAAPETFTPGLATLDGLIRSLEVVAP